MSRILFALLLLGSALSCPAQFSKAKLETLTRYLEGEVAAERLAGAVGYVSRHGRPAYFEAVGDGMRRDTLFRIASMTKAITSVAVMMLVEEGEITLTDPVDRYLPAFAVHDPPPTIHHLLTHTSGIGYGWFGPETQDGAYREAGVNALLVPTEASLKERIATLGALPLAFPPGEQWAYGMSTDVLGRVVEVVSGLTLSQFFRERIFRPLEMRDTHFYLPAAKQKRLAPLFTPNVDRTALLPVGSTVLHAGPIAFSADYCEAGKGQLEAGGSGLVSSTEDYARFLQMLLDQGRPLLRSDTVAQMTANQIGDLQIPFPGHGDGFGYGFGVLTERGLQNDVARVGTFSWGGIFNTYYWVDPQEEMIGILMTQVFPNDHLQIRSEFKRLAYEALNDAGSYHMHWYQQGLEHGNPHFNDRQLRVNAPEVSTHETFSQRSEPRSSGMARILVEADLRTIRRAKLYCEVWGGHPGTSHKRVNVNGRRQLYLPENGTATHHCTHLYPTFQVDPNALVNGYNSLQFACDQGDTFWGHYIVDNTCLMIDTGEEAPLDEPVIEVDPQGDLMVLSMPTAAFEQEGVTVYYQARYHGYDENGNGHATDWHGMTKNRLPYGMLGRATEPPWSLTWDTSMLPAQTQVAVKAYVYSQTAPNIMIEMPVTEGITLTDRDVQFLHVDTLPQPFWSRDGKRITATITLEMDPSKIERATLHVISWTGGPGTVTDYFTLNGIPFPVADSHDHTVNYVTLPVDPKILKRGPNEIVLLSDTKHHGIEILKPGPALAIRTRSQP